jgi:hypothetical protein
MEMETELEKLIEMVENLKSSGFGLEFKNLSIFFEL